MSWNNGDRVVYTVPADRLLSPVEIRLFLIDPDTGVAPDPGFTPSGAFGFLNGIPPGNTIPVQLVYARDYPNVDPFGTITPGDDVHGTVQSYDGGTDTAVVFFDEGTTSAVPGSALTAEPPPPPPGP